MSNTAKTSSHALFSTLASQGVDRVFLVPGESYLGLLDALVDVPEIDVVTCRHEAGAALCSFQPAGHAVDQRSHACHRAR